MILTPPKIAGAALMPVTRGRTLTTDDDRIIKSLRRRLARLLRRSEARIDTEQWDARLSAKIDALRIAPEALGSLKLDRVPAARPRR